MSTTDCVPAPFKCVGGKHKLWPAIRACLSSNFTGYAEPFLGGGAIFRHLLSSGQLDDKMCILADASSGTARAWRDVQKNPESTHQDLEAYAAQYNALECADAQRALYLDERVLWNAGIQTGARHIFLRNLAFNGLWRVNKAGKFNVPWSKARQFTPPDVRALWQAFQKAQRIIFAYQSFEDTFKAIQPDWLVYVDPPYLGEFDRYTQTGFLVERHVDLLKLCACAQAQGCHVVYSNRFCPQVRAMLAEHWPTAIVKRTTAIQGVAAKATARGVVEELLACSPTKA